MTKTEKENPDEQPIRQAIDIFEDHFREIATVNDWAVKMGRPNRRSFSDAFRRHYGSRPQPVLLAYRAKKAMQLLRNTTQSNFAIAQKLQLKDERGLYQFIRRQTGYTPTGVQKLPEPEYNALIERLDNNII